MSDENEGFLVPVETLETFAAQVLRKVGVPEEDSKLVASSLLEADMRGVGSHGVVRLGIYIDRLARGGTNPDPNPTIVRETLTTAVYDGDNGLGHLIGAKAMQLAIEKGSKGDVAFVAVRNSNHFGTAAYFADMAARQNMIGFSFTVGAINHMAPWGGAEALLGNNPFAISFPTREAFPVSLDMACSVAARGKIIVAAKEGKPIPADWATGPDGLPTTDAVEALKGFVIPVGGPKGYALSLTVGLLSTMLSGAAFGRDVGDLYDKPTEAQNSGHLFGVLPVSLFDDLDVYLDRMDQAIQDMRSAKRATGVERIYLPGEREHLSLVKTRAEGVNIGPGVAAELAELGQKYGVELNLPREPRN